MLHFFSFSILLFCAACVTFSLGSARIRAGGEASVRCDPSQSSSVFWFRITRAGPEYLLTVRPGKDPVPSDQQNIHFISGEKSVKILGFRADTDAGVYSCFSINNNQLKFGEATEVHAEAEPSSAPVTQKKTTSLPPTTTPCQCKTQKARDGAALLKCESWIFYSLVSGCLFLLLLLIFTIITCNRLRTRRCPHHYQRRRPEKLPDGRF